jgi:hypothetical protein
MTTGEDGTPSQKTGVEKSPSPRRCKVYKCGHHICPDLGIHTDKECSTLLLRQMKVLFYAQYHTFASVKLNLLLVTL